MTRPFAVITTKLPPAICGIGAYSARLRKFWPNEQRAVQFLVVDDRMPANDLMTGDSVTNFHARPRELGRALDELGDADVLLHYAGFAFHRFGFPFWMPRVLANWKQCQPGGRLMIFFHEVPGPLPWASHHFWLAKLNTRVVRQLADVADAFISNTRNHVDQLSRISQRNDIALVPIGSNIARIDELPARIETEFVLFGMSFSRWPVLQSFNDKINEWIRSGRLTRLHLIGPDDDECGEASRRLIALWDRPDVVIYHGMLAAPEVSRLLLRARFALTHVTAETWSKASTFMACAAHECAVVLRDRRPDFAPLSCGIGADEISGIRADEIDRRTAALRTWYEANADWPIAARKLASLLDDAVVDR